MNIPRPPSSRSLCQPSTRPRPNRANPRWRPHYKFRSFRPSNRLRAILVPRAHDPSGLWQRSRALARPDFLSMRRVFVSHSQPIGFARFDGKSVNRGLPVLDQTRALDPNRRPEGSWALGTKMPACRLMILHFSLQLFHLKSLPV